MKRNSLLRKNTQKCKKLSSIYQVGLEIILRKEKKGIFYLRIKITVHILFYPRMTLRKMVRKMEVIMSRDNTIGPRVN